jgi:hypothetical protein
LDSGDPDAHRLWDRCGPEQRGLRRHAFACRGLALGYAWVAATYPLGNLFLVYCGPAMLAAAALLLTFIGPPAPPVQDPSSGNATVN